MFDEFVDPRDQSPDALLAWAREQGVPDLAVRRLLSALIGPGVHDATAWGRDHHVPRRLTDRFRALPRLELARSITSPIDGFQKLAFTTQDGLTLETVLIPLHRPGAVSVCLSSQ